MMTEDEHKRARDVRMRGFTRRSLVETATRWIDDNSPLRATEHVPLESAAGRVLASVVRSGLDVPAFDRSAMDGYALRGGETVGAGEYNLLTFELAGESLPGKPFPGDVPPGSAVRIMTGAPIPQETDAVVPAEFATESENRVMVTTAVSPGKHVGRRGEDVHAGDLLFPTCRLLRPQDLGLLASVGHAGIDVFCRPKVRLLITGNELVSPGESRRESQIYESNSFMLRALVERDFGELESVRRLEDNRDSIRDGMTAGGADVVLVSGGTSVGAEDHAPTILAAEGKLSIHGIAMRPSSPTGMGRLGDAVVILLPGNPVSCLCAYDFFAGRAVRQMGGRPKEWPYRSQSCQLSRKIVSAVGRVDYCRVAFSENGLEPLALSGASILSSTTRADGFVIVPQNSEGYAPGAMVTAYLYDRGEPEA